MKRTVLFLLPVTLLAFCPPTLRAEANLPEVSAAESAEAWQWKLSIDRESRVFEVGETVRIKVQLRTESGQPVPNTRFRYFAEGCPSITGYTWCDTDAKGDAVIEITPDQPCFARCLIFVKDPTGKEIQKRIGAAFSPLAIRTGRPKPDDFDAYWDNIAAELRALPLEVQITPAPLNSAHYAGRVEVYDVRINTLGDTPYVYGYLCLPVGAAPQSLPIVMSYQGAGFRSSAQPLFMAAQGRIVFDINAHGILNGQPQAYYQKINAENPDYRTRGSDHRDTVYFRGMIIRALRALQYVKERPEWDGKTLIVTGGSQGGGQSLIAAGLDPDVTFCFAAVPALCDHGGAAAGREGGWPAIVRTTKNAPGVMEACDYIDAAFFASRISPQTECLLSVGFHDFVCPPSTVYAAFNAIPGERKRIIHDVDCDHEVPQTTWQEQEKAFAAHIERLKNLTTQ